MLALARVWPAAICLAVWWIVNPDVRAVMQIPETEPLGDLIMRMRQATGSSNALPDQATVCGKSSVSRSTRSAACYGP